MKTYGLGRGLDALMPEKASAGLRVKEVPVTEIDPNPSQPRRDFDEAALGTLCESIRQLGVLSPLLVTEEGGRYTLIAGERRWRASRLAGLSTVPVLVREAGIAERREVALVENLQREDLNPLEIAASVRALMDDGGLTQEAIAEKLGKPRATVANWLRLLDLPLPVQAMVRDGRLTFGHARALCGLQSPTRCMVLAERAVQEGLSVRELERQVSLAPTKTAKRVPPILAPELQQLSRRLSTAFGMKTDVQGTVTKGRITLTYTSREALERLYEALGEDV